MKSPKMNYLMGNHYFYAQVRCLLGLALEKEGKNGEAVAEYQKALVLNPQFPLALNYLAGNLAKSQDVKDIKKAVDLWERSISLYSNQPEIAILLRFYKNALTYYPDPTHRSLYLKTLGASPENAISTLLNLLHVDDQNVETKRSLAVSYMQNQQFDKAEQLLLENSIKDFTDIESYYLLGRLKLLEGKVEDALKYFKQVWNLKKNYRDTLVYLSDMNGQLGRFQNSIDYLQQALQEIPDAPEILFKLGYYFLKVNNPIEARKYFELAILNNPPLKLRQEIYKILQQKRS
jgi:tetratricopeptide (TPR) repeat protein